MIHARALANHVRLFFVLDNVDTVIHAQFGNVLSSVLEELISLDKSVQILTTSRDKRVDCEQLDVESVDLKPLSEGHCAQWLRSANTRGKKISEELIPGISESCGGIPLILIIMHSVAKRRPDLLAKELDSIKATDEWSQRLTTSLRLSFQLLTSEQSDLMKCASIFSSNFEKKTWLQMFQHRTQLINSGNEALQMCFDLSRI